MEVKVRPVLGRWASYLYPNGRRVHGIEAGLLRNKSAQIAAQKSRHHKRSSKFRSFCRVADGQVVQGSAR